MHLFWPTARTMISRTQFPTRHHGAKNLDKGTGLWWRVRSGEQRGPDRGSGAGRAGPEFAITRCASSLVLPLRTPSLLENIHQNATKIDLVLLEFRKKVIVIEQHVSIHLSTHAS